MAALVSVFAGCGGDAGVTAQSSPTAPASATQATRVSLRDAPSTAIPSPRDPGAAAPIVEPLAALLISDRARDRVEAVERLVAVQGIDALRLSLHDVNPLVRESAVDALAEIGTDEALLALQPMLDVADPELRELVVDALGEHRSATAAALLEQALSDPSSSVREAAGQYLEERAQLENRLLQNSYRDSD